MPARHPVPEGQWPAHAADATRIVFRGNGYDGSDRVGGGSLFLPVGSPPPGGWPVVSYATGLAPVLTGPERVHADRWLTAGYAVTVTEHHDFGPHPYLNGEAVADDVIDIVRAARGVDRRVGRTWLVAGFSRGGHTALFTGLVASRYAPELDFRGTIALAPPVHLPLLVAELTADGDHPVSPLLPLLLNGLRTDFLTGAGRLLTELSTHATLDELTRAARDLTNADGGFTRLQSRPGVAPVLEACRVPVTRMDRPVLITAGDADEVVPADVVARYAEDLRHTGADVRFDRHDATHLDLLSSGLDQIVAWARRPGFGRRSASDRDGRLTGDDFAVCALRLVQACGEPPGSPAAWAVRRGYAELWQAVAARSGAPVDQREFLHWLDSGRTGVEEVLWRLADAVLRLATGSDSVSAAEIASAVRDPGRTDDWLLGQL